MTTKYPSQIDGNAEIPVAVDLKTPVMASSVNVLRGAIIAIEQELGTDPSREFGTVRARIDALENIINTLSGDLGNIVPGLSKVFDEGSLVRNNVTEINFTGAAVAAVASASPGRVDVVVSGTSGVLFQVQETASVIMNGQTAFSLSSVPQDDDAVEMFLNGIKQQHGVDYTVSSKNVTYSGSTPITTADNVEFWYIAQASAAIGVVQETLPVSFDGQTTFNLSQTPADSSAVKMYVRGFKQDEGIDYTVSGSTVTWNDVDFTLITTDIVEFWYIVSGIVPGGGTGGDQTLSQVLRKGNATDGYDIIVSIGDQINANDVLILNSKSTNIVTIDGSPASVDVAGDMTINGKLTVTGLIDPTGLILDEAPAPTTTINKGAIFVSNGSGGLTANSLYYRPESNGTPTQIRTSPGDLASVLLEGNSSGGTNISMTDGDKIVAPDGYIELNALDSGTNPATIRMQDNGFDVFTFSLDDSGPPISNILAYHDTFFSTQDKTSSTDNISIITGNSSTSTSGNISILSGSSETNSGSITISTGNSSDDDSGSINISCGTSAGTSAGIIAIAAGSISSAVSGTRNGGNIQLFAGDGYDLGSGGSVEIRVGISGDNATQAGNVNIYTRELVEGANSSKVSFKVIDETLAIKTYLNIYRDPVNSLDGYIEAPNQSASLHGGDLYIKSQNAITSGFNGGDLILSSGSGGIAADLNGIVQLRAGSASSVVSLYNNLGDAGFSGVGSVVSGFLLGVDGLVFNHLSGPTITQVLPPTNTAGQTLSIIAQTGNGSGNGGQLTLSSGNSGSTAGTNAGSVVITGGSGQNNGGNVSITAGEGTSGFGGNINLTSGEGQSSGSISILVGVSNNGPGGDINIAAGNGVGVSKAGGDINITAGSSTNVAGDGVITLKLTSGSNPDGYVRLNKDDNAFIVFDPNDSAIQLNSSSSTIVFEEIADHSSTPAAAHGMLWVRNDTPNVLVFTDDVGTDWDISTGGTPSSIGLNGVLLNGNTTGLNATSDGYDIVFSGSISVQDSIRIGGVGGIDFDIDFSSTATSTAAAINITGQQGGSTSNGGNINITSGAGGSSSGNGGSINITAGTASSGLDGYVSITGGNVSFDSEGSVDISIGGSSTASFLLSGTSFDRPTMYFDGPSSQSAGSAVFGVASDGSSGSGADLYITAQPGITTGVGGDVILLSGSSTGANSPGSFEFAYGSPDSNTSVASLRVNAPSNTTFLEFYETNTVIHNPGAADNSNSSISIAGGNSTSGNNDGGMVSFAAGTGNGSGAGGDLTIAGGNGGSSNGAGGDVLLICGAKNGSGASGTISLYNSAFTQARIIVDDTGLAFNGATPIAKPTITGSRAGNAALASLLTALDNMGFITNSTS